MTVVGIDACQRGWIVITLGGNHEPRGHFIQKLDLLLDTVPDAQAVAIDIPIGLVFNGRRRADVEARRFLGPRRSSVFFTPVREALVASTHAEASAISQQLTGHGISQQAYALAPKILEAERWSAAVPIPVWEVHPEVSFAVLMGHPARSPKSTWSGIWERQRALQQAGISLSNVGQAGEQASPDDVLDAAAAAWSAARLHGGHGISLPDPPEIAPSSTRQIAIWA
jgi:predicted RNase H-like nuclease